MEGIGIFVLSDNGSRDDDENPSWVLLLMIQMGDTRPVAQADGRGFSKLETEESGGESRPPVASARIENGEWRMENKLSLIRTEHSSQYS
ncbi:hypothetical protein PRIPAC_95723, partial [Pristionchus pacificus]|uniref:Uncharacterized protein n=1 Tax=Pristionchus pacificus TaxID=54126 RepID=A0A2A6D1C4_PRIPA